jgi:hypothetical protein
VGTHGASDPQEERTSQDAARGKNKRGNTVTNIKDVSAALVRKRNLRITISLSFSECEDIGLRSRLNKSGLRRPNAGLDLDARPNE